MANLKEIRGRMSSVKNIQQVTKAMNMVAAAKLRRAQDMMFRLRPYTAKLEEIMDHILSGVDMEEIPSDLVQPREEVKNILMVLVTSNRGLAGPFNANIIREAFLFLNEHHQEELNAGRVHFLCIGKKGYDHVRKRKYPLIGQNHDVFHDLTFERVNEVTEKVFDLFRSGEVDKVYLSYNEFRNVMSQNRKVEPFLPLVLEEGEAEAQGQPTDYIYEPEQQSILLELIPKALRVQMYRAAIESNAAEQGARMVAMDTATENAEDLLKDLKLTYNKARQAAITKEILEISAGADALEAS